MTSEPTTGGGLTFKYSDGTAVTAGAITIDGTSKRLENEILINLGAGVTENKEVEITLAGVKLQFKSTIF
ncbi:hypothetical protein KHA80_11715 [Anaerobacillus sp. HL2]|nr:hypothetical protein KHA80_11715 [Anaerobacillus sp. HL2]